MVLTDIEIQKSFTYLLHLLPSMVIFSFNICIISRILMLVFTFYIAMNNDDCLERKILYHNFLEAGET